MAITFMCGMCGNPVHPGQYCQEGRYAPVSEGLVFDPAAFESEVLVETLRAMAENSSAAAEEAEISVNFERWWGLFDYSRVAGVSVNHYQPMPDIELTPGLIKVEGDALALFEYRVTAEQFRRDCGLDHEWALYRLAAGEQFDISDWWGVFHGRDCLGLFKAYAHAAEWNAGRGGNEILRIERKEVAVATDATRP